MGWTHRLALSTSEEKQTGSSDQRHQQPSQTPNPMGCGVVVGPSAWAKRCPEEDTLVAPSRYPPLPLLCCGAVLSGGWWWWWWWGHRIVGVLLRCQGADTLAWPILLWWRVWLSGVWCHVVFLLNPPPPPGTRLKGGTSRGASHFHSTCFQMPLTALQPFCNRQHLPDNLFSNRQSPLLPVLWTQPSSPSPRQAYPNPPPPPPGKGG